MATRLAFDKVKNSGTDGYYSLFGKTEEGADGPEIYLGKYMPTSNDSFKGYLSFSTKDDGIADVMVSHLNENDTEKFKISRTALKPGSNTSEDFQDIRVGSGIFKHYDAKPATIENAHGKLEIPGGRKIKRKSIRRKSHRLRASRRRRRSTKR
jgi:hypothetical protein